LNGEVSERGTLRASAKNFEAGCFCGEPVEEFVLAAASHDVEALETLAGDGGYVAEYFGISHGQAVKEERGKLWGVVGREIELGKMAAA
jgi:hypothetical protein